MLRHGVPVLRRTDGVQVGIADPVRFPAPSEHEARILAALEGPAVAAELPDALRAPLAASGVLAQPATKVRELSVRIRGVSAFCLITATALAKVGVSAIGIVAGDHQDETARHLRDLAPGVRWLPPHARAEMEVVMGYGVIDPIVYRGLMVDDIPHLPVVVDDRFIRVGAMVIPGKTPCENCRGRGRVKRDADWPLLGLQLSSRHIHPEVARMPSFTTAAGLAASAIFGCATGQQSEPAAVEIWSGRAHRPNDDDVENCGCRLVDVASDEGEDLRSVAVDFGRPHAANAGEGAERGGAISSNLRQA